MLNYINTKSFFSIPIEELCDTPIELLIYLSVSHLIGKEKIKIFVNEFFPKKNFINLCPKGTESFLYFNSILYASYGFERKKNDFVAFNQLKQHFTTRQIILTPIIESAIETRNYKIRLLSGYKCHYYGNGGEIEYIGKRIEVFSNNFELNNTNEHPTSVEFFFQFYKKECQHIDIKYLYYKNSLLHRVNNPAEILYRYSCKQNKYNLISTSKCYYLNDRLHNIKGPSMTTAFFNNYKKYNKHRWFYIGDIFQKNFPEIQDQRLGLLNKRV